MLSLVSLIVLAAVAAATDDAPVVFPTDPGQSLERTCFQTGAPWSTAANLRSDVAIVYGIGTDLSGRIKSWRERGYRIHVMTGVAWGAYQDYIHGRFDGVDHRDEEQTDRRGIPHRHGGDVYYMCPGTNYGKFLCVGIQRALDAGAEAIHLEEPEFWVQDGYEEGFKREWKHYYGEDWQPPHGSVDAQWRASKLKYFLYRRALQQIFDYVQEYNRKSGRQVRCYVPTHSLLNYAHWRIVSPESSLARLQGCDGYIAQVWTGTSRTPNLFRGALRERTFETAFLEYGAMQNLVRATGRSAWYLNDPVEDDPSHTWEDYQANWESTLVASLFQPDVWQYEVAPWPERVFAGKYKNRNGSREAIPPAYATELQIVMNSLNDMKQSRIQWDCGTTGIGILVSDSLMFERGDPAPSDPHLSHVYGLALPLLKRGIPVTPVQLENVTVPGYLGPFRLLLLSYQGMKPLTADVHASLAAWVKHGGALVVVDDKTDPFNGVREWWNQGMDYASPLDHLLDQLGVKRDRIQEGSGKQQSFGSGKGTILWLRENPAHLATSEAGDKQLVEFVRQACLRSGLKWRETNYLLLRRGPYLVGAGLDESIASGPRTLHGRFVNLFDPELHLRNEVKLTSGSRWFLVDLDRLPGRVPRVLAAACKTQVVTAEKKQVMLAVEGIAETKASVLLFWPGPAPSAITLNNQPLKDFEHSATQQLLWIGFENAARPRLLRIAH